MRLICFVGVLAILWLPLAIPIYIFFQQDPNLASILTMVLLFFELLWFWQVWGKVIHQEKDIFSCYGLIRSRKNSSDFLKGLAIGFYCCLSLYIVEGALGWIEVVTSSVSLGKIVAEGLLSAIGIALAEELLFRGWLLDELSRDYSKKTCLWVGSITFAIAHFLKPIDEIVRTAVNFPALVLLGMILILAKYNNCDRLGICIGIHGGLILTYYIIDVGQLIEYTNQVSSWVTGIDGNPIGGIMGLIFLSALLWIIGKPKSSQEF